MTARAFDSTQLTELLDALHGTTCLPGVRCPRCRWRPRRDSRWCCGSAVGCGHSWNTFETRGRCPKCQRQWRLTQCLSCHAWPVHEDWYERDEERS